MPRCPYCNVHTSTFQAQRTHIAQTIFCRDKDEENFDEPDSDIDQHGSGASSNPDDNTYSPISFNNDSLDSTPEEKDNPRKHAWVEDVEDDDSNDPKSIYQNTNFVYSEIFPRPAGSPLNDTPIPTSFEKLRSKQRSESKIPWAPFQSEKEWELAHWLVTSGISNAKIDEFCKLKTIKEDVKPSYHNSRSFLQFIDALERGPTFHCTPMRIEGDLKDANGQTQTEILELWHRDPVEVVKELMGNRAFYTHQQYAPIRHYRDKARKNRDYSEMWTCNWWWDVQEKLPEHVTIAPCIIASDQTQLSTFSGDKKAWPVYLSIGNIEKAIRRKPSARAFLLLGYIPTSKLECFSEKERSQAGYQLFHDCMKKILEPLEKAGREGVKMICADGYERLVFPLLGAYIADYPEQCLVCCCKENSCPRCTVDPQKRGDLVHSILRSPETTVQALYDESKGLGLPAFHEQQLRPINPFWVNLPHCNIFECITPDLLHQLHKGLFGDHVSKWARATIPSGKEEVDRRFRTMTPHPSVRHFSKGISTIKQWTGNEYKAMAKVFPAMLAGAADGKVLEAVRAFEDFLYYAHFEVHTDESLRALDAAWDAFHEHKEIFRDLEIRQHFNISKLHNVSHYADLIRSRGTADGFNSESSERLHIDFAKVGYRASNKRHFQTQMTTWLARQEAVRRHREYLKWAVPRYDSEGMESWWNETDESDESTNDDSDSDDDRPAPVTCTSVTYDYAKQPPCPKTTLEQIKSVWNCGDWFLWYLEKFFIEQSIPLDILSNPDQILLPVWKKLRLHLPTIAEAESECSSDTVYATSAIPGTITSKGVTPPTPARTSTVIIQTGESDPSKGPLHGLSIGRVRLLFKIPPEIAAFPHLLAFVDWFTPLQKYNNFTLGMYQISYATRQHEQHSGIIFADTIQQTCHLSPDFGRTVNPNWNCQNVLDQCKTFYINPYLRSRDFFLLRYQRYLYDKYIEEQGQKLPVPRKRPRKN
ncbi:hypothetical protein VKT23_009520 [Stygiomarasmius scandens]|uniref:Uncharacterized protein n=1 Tax=Marasmiellus scandens TaxID=2682957 RepID=A0ABR1JET0_9AGAR